MALSYSKNDLINAQDKFELGAYTTRLVTFDPFNCEYNVYNPNASENEQSDGLSLGGKSLPKLNPEFDVSGDKKNFSRTTYVLLILDLCQPETLKNRLRNQMKKILIIGMFLINRL